MTPAESFAWEHYNLGHTYHVYEGDLVLCDCGKHFGVPDFHALVAAPQVHHYRDVDGRPTLWNRVWFADPNPFPRISLWRKPQ